MGAPVRDKTKLGTFTTLIAGGVAVLAYILRAIARLPVFGGNWGLDDWVMTAAIVLPQTFTTIMYQDLRIADPYYSAYHLRISL